MKPKTMILMVVAVVCGLGASYMTSKLLAERNKENNEPTVPVLVAKMRVKSWQPIRDPERMFEIRQFPVSVAPNKPLGDFPEILNQRLNKPIDEGKPVSQADLLTKEQYSMSENLANGQRTMAIKVTPESLAGGFVLPGTRVDVVLTSRNGQEATARILLQNMLVMAVDTQDQRADGVRTALGQTVTLAVTPEEATRLSLAASSGDLRLLLKNVADVKRIYNVETKMSDLKRPLLGDGEKDPDAPRPLSVVSSLPVLKDEPKTAPAPVEVKKPDPPRRRRFVMKIINGTTIERAVFPLDPPEAEDDEEAPASSPPSTPRKDDARTETRKPDPPRPAPPATPATPTVPSPFGKSTRTGRIS